MIAVPSAPHGETSRTFGPSRHSTLDTLARGVYAAIQNDSGGYAICNAGIIDLGDRTLILWRRSSLTEVDGGSGSATPPER